MEDMGKLERQLLIRRREQATSLPSEFDLSKYQLPHCCLVSILNILPLLQLTKHTTFTLPFLLMKIVNLEKAKQHTDPVNRRRNKKYM